VTGLGDHPFSLPLPSLHFALLLAALLLVTLPPFSSSLLPLPFGLRTQPKRKDEIAFFFSCPPFFFYDVFLFVGFLLDSPFSLVKNWKAPTSTLPEAGVSGTCNRERHLLSNPFYYHPTLPAPLRNTFQEHAARRY